MSTSTLAIAAMAAQRRKLERHFIQARAFSAETAIAPGSLPANRFRLLEKLRRQGIVLDTPDGQLYLDHARLEAVRAAARATTTRMLLVLVAALALAMIALAVSGYLSAR